MWPLVAMWAIDIITTESGCARIADPVKVFGNILDLDVTMALGGLHMPLGSSFRKQPDLRWWPKSLSSSWPSMVPGALDINTDYGCSSVMNPDMAPSWA